MRNKYLYICYGIIIAFFCFSNNNSYANDSTQKQYIVEFKDDISLFNICQNDVSVNVLSEKELSKCIESGIVEWYEEDYVVELFDTDEGETDFQSDNLKWHLTMINAGKAREVLCEGQGVNIGIIDSGISAHPDIQDRIMRGYNYINKNTDVTDNIGHGTFVAGLIVADSNQEGICGVATKTNIIPLKCFDSNVTTTVSMLCLAIKEAVDVYDCDIINMSLGLTNNSKKLEEYIDYATDAGTIVVAAVGNKGSNVLYYPAAYDNVIGVGSVNENYKKSSFSQYNSSVEFLAPGENVWSTTNKSGYTKKSGTSFSTPIVAGLIGEMMNIDDDITLDEIRTYLSETTLIRDEWRDGETYQKNDYYGYGLIDVSGCLAALIEEYTYFLSPIDNENSENRIAVVNNSDENFEGYCMWGEYSHRGMTDMDWEYVVIPPGESVIADTHLNGNSLKCFLWRSFDDISAIADFREREEI